MTFSYLIDNIDYRFEFCARRCCCEIWEYGYKYVGCYNLSEKRLDNSRGSTPSAELFNYIEKIHRNWIFT